MKILVKNNPLFTDFIGEKLARRYNIETMMYVNKENFTDSYLITQYKKDDKMAKAVMNHMLRLIPLKEPDTSGFKGAAADFLYSKVTRLS